VRRARVATASCLPPLDGGAIMPGPHPRGHSNPENPITHAMSFRDDLSAVLRGDRAADLAPADREWLETLAHEAQAAGEAVTVRNECAGRIKQGGASGAVEYLLAAACALNAEVERAHQTLLTLGERLAAAHQWEPLAAVAERALALEETHAAARLLVRAHEGLGKDPARLEALERAWAINPDDLELGLLVAVRLGEAHEGERRRTLLTELLPRFAAESRWEGLEEAALEFVEHGEHEGLVTLLRILPSVAEAGAVREAQQLLGIAFPEVARAGRAGEAHAALRALANAAVAKEGAAAVEPLRDALVESLRQGPARELPDAEPVIALAGVTDRMRPLLPALERFDLIAALPPGRAVHHASFGAGRIASNDGEEVRIDFAHAKGHRMPYAAARRTLGPIAEDDLRLLRVTDPAALTTLRAEQPAEVVARALAALGGAADAQKLKVFLVGSDLVPAAEWTAFWRRARAEAAKHPRIDSSRAFEQHYRLAAAGPARAADDAPLPALEPRKSVKTNLATLRKFLSQHPQAEAALAQRFGKFVARAMADPEGEAADRARAGLYVARWLPDRAGEWREVLKSLWEHGLSISDLSGEDEQRALLEASHAAGVESDAILSALDSRFSAVRDEAERLRAQLDDRGRADMRRTLLLHAPRYPSAALRRIEEAFGSQAESRGPEDAWRLLWAAIALIEERPKPSTADKVLRWLEPGGAFDKLLEGVPPPEEARLKLRVTLRQWRSSDRFLFPALEALDRLGLGDESSAVRNARQARSEKLFDRVGQQAEEADLPVMTRATFERLTVELERMERELRTTIPATIQKARELGDLRENAEYHSAKLKQANVSKLVAALQLRLSRAKFVDEMTHTDGVVGLGTEVVLESDEDVRSFWILGEGEQHHGEHVVSFQAPVGRALMGHTIGDEIELGEGDTRRRYRVVSIERKLPPRAETAPESSRS
jgi:transcription elongation factor GreA